MPTYYNGKEITATSKLSGVNLTGKSSIKIGGKVISLESIPPDGPLKMTIYGSSGSSGLTGYPDPLTSCNFGSNGLSSEVFISEVVDGEQTNFYLFLDEKLSYPLSPGWYWTDDARNIGVNFGPDGGSIWIDPNYQNFPGSGLVFQTTECRRR